MLPCLRRKAKIVYTPTAMPAETLAIIPSNLSPLRVFRSWYFSTFPSKCITNIDSVPHDMTAEI